MLVVDDHTVMRKGLCALLRAGKYGLQVVGETGSGQEAVELARQLSPDVVLMDLVMPGMDGIEATRQICAENPAVRVLVLTSFTQQPRVIGALKAGATGYFLKDAAPEDLVRAIHNVALGLLTVPRELARAALLNEVGPLVQGVEAPLPHAPDPLACLTGRERDVARLVGRGYTNQQIADELYIELSTVRSHVSNILHKLGLENRTQIALYGRDL